MACSVELLTEGFMSMMPFEKRLILYSVFLMVVGFLLIARDKIDGRSVAEAPDVQVIALKPGETLSLSNHVFFKPVLFVCRGTNEIRNGVFTGTIYLTGSRLATNALSLRDVFSIRVRENDACIDLSSLRRTLTYLHINGGQLYDIPSFVRAATSTSSLQQ